MRDYINRLSRGSSIIKVPKLSCSEEQITMDIMCNTVATGSFICDATDKVYGMVYADNERVKILSEQFGGTHIITCLLYTSPSPRDRQKSRMPSSA